jgi:hypothetical protein
MKQRYRVQLNYDFCIDVTMSNNANPNGDVEAATVINYCETNAGKLTGDYTLELVDSGYGDYVTLPGETTPRRSIEPQLEIKGWAQFERELKQLLKQLSQRKELVDYELSDYVRNFLRPGELKEIDKAQADMGWEEVE